MHELALARGVVDVIETEARKSAFTRVARVVLDIGALSCVDPHALEFGFEAAARGTVAEGACLDIRTPPGVARCFACEADVEISARGDACPHCGSHMLVPTGGDEMKIRELEVV